MSVRVTRLVWETFSGTLNERLCLLALADYADDKGGRIFPSVAALARKLWSSPDHARRLLRRLERTGVIRVTGNASGGAPGQTRHYQIDVTGLQAGAYRYPTPLAKSQAVSVPLAKSPPLANRSETPGEVASLTIINHQLLPGRTTGIGVVAARASKKT
jgi:hypothetical protein